MRFTYKFPSASHFKYRRSPVLELLWQYTIIFIMAATPWLEILIVIPLGIGMGLDPFLVALLSFTGNFLPVLFIIYALHIFQRTRTYRKWKVFWKRKRRHKKRKSRSEKAQHLFHRYGLPGLAVLGPALTGIHLAAVIALSLQAGKHRTAWWMGLSLILWTVFLTISSVFSIDWLQNVF
ncbi:MAG: small multidrug efflux protein - like protein [Alkalicoccus sp.]|nr:MAG: small multidrug efflux protein - like protein [Alkalicoccus sp.]